MPQRDVFERGLQVAAQHARQPAELLRLDRVALVRHRARALLLALAERLLDLAHLGALQVADLERERLDARADRRARVQHFGVAVARQHLRRGHRREPEVLAHVALDRGIDVGVRADRARELADRDRRRGPAPAARGRAAPASPRARASRRTSSARRGCRACGRPSACRGTRAPAPRSPTSSCRPRPDDAVERARHLQRERGVDDVARREPVVHPRARRLPDALLHDVDERGDVVVGDLLALVHRGDVEAGPLAHRPRASARARRRARAHASTASTSTSSHAPKRASSVNRSAISGSE